MEAQTMEEAPAGAASYPRDDKLPSFMGGNVAALALALAKAQGMMTAASRDGVNPQFGKSFATLAGIWDAAREPLSVNGLAVTQLPRTDGNRVSVTTVLLHSEGGWMMTVASATAKDAGPQAIGSVITYLRRYCLAAICGIAQEDDDGESGESRDQGKQATRQQSRQQPRQQNQRSQRSAGRPESKKPEPKQGEDREATPPTKADPLEAALKEEPVFPDTLAVVERRLAHAKLPAEKRAAAVMFLKSKGVQMKDDGTVADIGGLDEWNARKLVIDVTEALRAANTQKKEG